MKQVIEFASVGTQPYAADVPSAVVTGWRESTTTVVARGRSQTVVFSSAWESHSRVLLREVSGEASTARLYAARDGQVYLAWSLETGEVRTEVRGDRGHDVLTPEALADALVVDGNGDWPQIGLRPPLAAGNIRDGEERDRVMLLATRGVDSYLLGVTFVLDGGLGRAEIAGDEFFGAVASVPSGIGVTVACGGSWARQDELRDLAQSVAESLAAA